MSHPVNDELLETLYEEELDYFTNNPTVNDELLETLYEEAYADIKANNIFDFDEDGIRFNAECVAQQRFEDMSM